jgi:hypothetical protein
LLIQVPKTIQIQRHAKVVHSFSLLRLKACTTLNV